MLERILPRPVDNTYHGCTLAIWIFGCIVLVKIAMSLNVIFNGRFVASSADGIPLDTFTTGAARTVIAIFAIWGLAQLVTCVLCVVVVTRYRGLIPFVFALLLLEALARRLILHFLPITRTGQPPGLAINLALLAMTIVGLALSLRGPGGSQPGASPTRCERRRGPCSRDGQHPRVLSKPQHRYLGRRSGRWIRGSVPEPAVARAGAAGRDR